MESTEQATPAAKTEGKKAKLQHSDPALRERTALQIYIDKLKNSRRGMDPKVVAAESFREAKAFCEMAEAFREFGDEALSEALPPEPCIEYQGRKYYLDDASAPKLKPDHPFNLRSRRFGTIETLERMVRMEHEQPEEYRKLCNAVGSN